MRGVRGVGLPGRGRAAGARGGGVRLSGRGRAAGGAGRGGGRLSYRGSGHGAVGRRRAAGRAGRGATGERQAAWGAVPWGRARRTPAAGARRASRGRAGGTPAMSPCRIYIWAGMNCSILGFGGGGGIC
eukprot:XP_020406355.1 spidroin-1-like [Zea mays]